MNNFDKITDLLAGLFSWFFLMVGIPFSLWFFSIVDITLDILNYVSGSLAIIVSVFLFYRKKYWIGYGFVSAVIINSVVVGIIFDITGIFISYFVLMPLLLIS